MSLDWPLSREEKKSRLLLLYDKDVQALSDAQRFDELRIEVLRQELRTAHLRGDIPSQIPCHQSFGELPRARLGSERLPDAAVLRQSAGHARCSVESSADTAQDSLDPLRLVLGFAKEAVDDGFAALGSLWRNAVFYDGPDSDEDACRLKARARSEGARGRELVAAPALKKPHSRRNSRGAPPLHVSFLDRGDEDLQGKTLVQGCSEPLLLSGLEENEPMGEPEPASPDGSWKSEGFSTCQAKPATTLNHLCLGSSAFQEHTGPCWTADGKDGGSWSGRATHRSQRGSDLPRQELRMLLATEIEVPNEGAGKIPGPMSRRARLRGRLHGYSICDVNDEEHVTP